LQQLRLFDPACGCGNFLVIAYCELRRLERAIDSQLVANGAHPSAGRVGLHQFYGIEKDPLAAAIARTTLLLVAQLGLTDKDCPGEPTVAAPWHPNSPTIHAENALRIDWQDVLPPSPSTFIFGNPPFVGKKERTEAQKHDMLLVFGNQPRIGVLDYATCWLHKAARYMVGTSTEAAFVSTNSITHGEQPSVLWEALGSPQPSIHFAHRTFNWTGEARGVAQVHCVILGFRFVNSCHEKRLFDYKDMHSQAKKLRVTNINAYLIDGPSVLITKRRKPLVKGILAAREGSKLGDWGHLCLNGEEFEALRADPLVSRYLRPLVGAVEMIHGINRWCLWFGDGLPRESEARRSPWVATRLRAVQAARLASTKASTRTMARQPGRFLERRQPTQRYLMIPCVSSSRRHYIPMRFYEPTT
ncbi:MAG: DNA methyltransferase, partial [Nannocystaceae bacterium]